MSFLPRKVNLPCGDKCISPEMCEELGQCTAPRSGLACQATAYAKDYISAVDQKNFNIKNANRKLLGEILWSLNNNEIDKAKDWIEVALALLECDPAPEMRKGKRRINRQFRFNADRRSHVERRTTIGTAAQRKDKT